MKYRRLGGLLLAGVAYAFWGCSSSDAGTPSTVTNNGGSVGVGGSTSLTPGGNAGTAGTAGSGGQVTAGGAAGAANGGAGGAAAGAPAGGTGGTVAGAGGAGGTAGGAGGETGGGGTGGAGVTASCADHPEYDLCIDFETGIPAAWTGGTENSIDTTHAAHGSSSYHLYHCPQDPPPVDGAQCNGSMAAGKLTAMNLGAITNQMWGRMYVHFSPGAPGGHGNIVAMFDQDDNWYEMGWQFDGIMGVYHLSNGQERPTRSMPYMVDQWYCVEFFIDGTKTEMQTWYIDGPEAMYHMAVDNLTPLVVQSFDRIEVGFTPYAGLGIRQPDNVGDQTEMRTLTDMWIDDIAFDTERIGCVAGPVGQ